MKTTGAGGILLNERREVLLILRKNSPTFNDLWSGPGGKIEGNESPEQTAEREFKEEVGLIVKVNKSLGRYIDRDEGKVRGFYKGFLVDLISGSLMIKEPEKLQEARYFPLNELPENLAPFTREYIKALRR